MPSAPPAPHLPAPPEVTDDRGAARARLQARRDFASHAAAYVVVNAVLIGIWLATSSGYFWPGWIVGAWGAGLALHAFEVFVHRPVTEADVDAEIARHRGTHAPDPEPPPRRT